MKASLSVKRMYMCVIVFVERSLWVLRVKNNGGVTVQVLTGLAGWRGRF